jgi:hypothetical protein
MLSELLKSEAHQKHLDIVISEGSEDICLRINTNTDEPLESKSTNGLYSGLYSGLYFMNGLNCMNSANPINGLNSSKLGSTLGSTIGSNPLNPIMESKRESRHEKSLGSRRLGLQPSIHNNIRDKNNTNFVQSMARYVIMIIYTSGAEI